MSGATSPPTASSTTTSRRSQFPGIHGVNALKVTAAHEFHHASSSPTTGRKTAGCWRRPRPTWRPTSTGRSTTTTSTSRRARSSSNTADRRPLVAGRPVRPDVGNQYGSWIFFRFLEEYFGSATTRRRQRTCDQPRRSGTRRRPSPGTNNGGTYSTQAIAAAIDARTDPITSTPADFSDVFATSAGPTRSRPRWYKDGAQYPSRLDCVNRGFFGSGDSDGAELADVPLRQRLRALQTGPATLVDYRLHARLPAHR